MGAQRKLTDYRLRDYVDMQEQDAMKCFEKIDKDLFLKNPTEALHKAGVITKPGVDFRIIKNESEITSLPSNVYPFLVTDKLPEDALDNVAGGVSLNGLLHSAEHLMHSAEHRIHSAEHQIIHKIENFFRF